jgi:hypothetical protein
VTARELDDAYVLLSQTMTRTDRRHHELYLSRLVLLLLASHGDAEAASAAIRDAGEISAIAAELAAVPRALSDGAA